MIIMRIRHPYQNKPTGEGASIPYDYKIKVALDIMKFDIKAFMDSITAINDPRSFRSLLVEHLSMRLIDFCARVLSLAVEYCPYDTGALRSSGTVDLVVGEGERVQDNVVSVQADKGGNFDIRVNTPRIKSSANRLGCYIYFDRQDRGLDIALWAHEVLLPAKNRPSKKKRQSMGKKVWYAKQAGTGPKYLEKAYKECEGTFNEEMSAAVWTAVKAYNKIHGQKVRKK